MMRLQILLTLVLIGPVAAWGRRRRRRTQTICDDVPEVVTEDTTQCRPVTKERTVLRTVTKFKKGMKTVTRYEKATRLVNRTQMVEYLLPVEAFLLEAKQQIIWESQESLRRSGINSRSVNADVRFNETSAGTEALVLYGPSQGGKSTFVCQLRKAKDAACPKVGDGSGESMTDEPSLWETILGWVLDNPGNGDTRLLFTEEEIGLWMATALAEADVRRVKFLVFDSMANDAMHLRETLSALFTSFGTNVGHGTVIIASKANLRPRGGKRNQLLRDVMQEQGLEELVFWNGPDLDAQCLEDLRASLARVRSVPISALEDLWERQSRRAQELCDQQPPQWKEGQVEVEEDYLENKSVEEPYEIPYTEQEPYEEKYETNECSTVPVRKTVMARKCRVVEL